MPRHPALTLRTKAETQAFQTATELNPFRNFFHSDKHAHPAAKRRPVGPWLTALALCLLLAAGESAAAREPSKKGRRNAASLALDSVAAVQTDSLIREISLEEPFNEAAPLPAPADTVAAAAADTAEAFKPVPQKSIWLAALCPGLGQIYNRRYWKVPIVLGAAVGVTYAISWNNKYYEAYTYAYRDLTDNDPYTNYHITLLGANAASQKTLIQNRQQSFRRMRDLSIIIGAACYLLSVLDAYVDAELFNFDISDDISLELGPSPCISEPVSDRQMAMNPTPLSFSWSIRF